MKRSTGMAGIYNKYIMFARTVQPLHPVGSVTVTIPRYRVFRLRNLRRLLAAPQLLPVDLSRSRQREALDELDGSRVFVGGQLSLHVLLDTPLQRIRWRHAGRQTDQRLHDRSADGVRRGDHSRLGDLV